MLQRAGRAAPWTAGLVVLVLVAACSGGGDDDAGSNGSVAPTTASTAEKSMLDRARGILVSELSFALNVTEDDALTKLEKGLE